MKILVVVDCQEDFISGSLGSPEAQAIVPNVIEKIKNLDKYSDYIILTQDAHYDNTYLDTQEGKNLPIKHCIFNTNGARIDRTIIKTLEKYHCAIFQKNTFGSKEMVEFLYGAVTSVKNTVDAVDTIEFVGLCTDICVISNALITKAYLPEVEIIVDASCCAGVTPESHKAALTVMKSCQIKVINEY